MIVLDTHVILWWVSNPDRLSAAASKAIAAAINAARLSASSISIFEIATASRRGRIELGRPVDQWLDELRSLPQIQFQPVTTEIARAAGALGEEIPGDPMDRIIVATAAQLGAKLVTADRKLAKSGLVPTIW